MQGRKETENGSFVCCIQEWSSMTSLLVPPSLCEVISWGAFFFKGIYVTSCFYKNRCIGIPGECLRGGKWLRLLNFASKAHTRIFLWLLPSCVKYTPTPTYTPSGTCHCTHILHTYTACRRECRRGESINQGRSGYSQWITSVRCKQQVHIGLSQSKMKVGLGPVLVGTASLACQVDCFLFRLSVSLPSSAWLCIMLYIACIAPLTSQGLLDGRFSTGEAET